MILLAALGWLGAPQSQAAEQPLKHIVNQGAWAAGLDPTQGGVTDNIAIFTPSACPAGTTRHVTKIVAVRAATPSDQPDADKWLAWGNLYSPTPAELPGPLKAFPASMNWKNVADLRGLRIVPGAYEVQTRCQDNLGQKVFQVWRGQVVFDSPTHYTIPAPFATPDGKSAMASKEVAAQGGSGGSAATPPGPGSNAVPSAATPSTGRTPVPTTGGAAASSGPAEPPATSDAAGAAAPTQSPAASPGTSSAVMWFAGLLAVLGVGGVIALVRRRPSL